MTKVYKLSFDFAGVNTGKPRVYYKTYINDAIIKNITILNATAGQTGHMDWNLPTGEEYEKSIVYFGANTGGTASFTNVSITEV